MLLSGRSGQNGLWDPQEAWMGGGAAGRNLRRLGLGQQREQRRSAGSAAGRLLCLPAGVTCGGAGVGVGRMRAPKLGAGTQR